ncbi:MAG: ATP-binding protein [Chitinispirillaceae bacterium]|nr:ATP-binding protein [Chitinispirillaceae bacterium]
MSSENGKRPHDPLSEKCRSNRNETVTTMSSAMPNVSIVPLPSLPEVCLIRLCGDLDVANLSAFDSCLETLPGSDKKHAIADMSGVTLISSAALGKLLGLKRRFMEMGGDLVLAAMDIDLKMKFTLMGANKIFKIYGDLRSAANAYAWEVKHETERIKVSFPSNLAIVPAVRSFVSRTMQHKGYSDRDSFRVETIVDEICNNAVQYGLHHDDDNITLNVNVSWDKVEIDAENKSDPEKAGLLRVHMQNLEQDISVDSGDKRGRGLALVKMLASVLSADINDTGTTVHVTKLKEE